MALLLLVLFSFCYSFVISVDGVEYHKQDFYSKYSMVEWERASEKQRRVMLEDYIKRESAVLAALSFGFNLDPVVVSRLKNIKKQQRGLRQYFMNPINPGSRSNASLTATARIDCTK